MIPSSDDFLIKICGLATRPTLEASITAGATLLGLVFFPKSPRNLAPDKAATLVNRAKSSVNTGMARSQIVGLFVDPDDATLDNILARLPLDYIQLHGREDTARIRAIKSRTGLPIIKAMGIGGQDDLIAARAYADIADMLLFDAKPPPGTTRPGGLGRIFDWRCLSAYDAEAPFLLSGGLTPDNVAQAVNQMRDIPGFSGLDVSSGVETAPGNKDIPLIERFIRNAREAVGAV